RMAGDWLINRDDYSSFVRETAPYFSRQKITRFAENQRRHPGIILGRLQNDENVPYTHLRQLLEKVRDYLGRWNDVPN
ncbi:addiction module antidote protein, HigA family, partial [bacterium]|nr:addiction module antidote protein, HigA family [bacterium]